MNSQILRKITEKTASAEEFIEENHEALSSSRSIVKDHRKKQSSPFHSGNNAIQTYFN